MQNVNAPELEFQSKAKKLRGDALIAHHLNGIRLAIKEHSENTGKWLAAIALAASTPGDNSEAVQKQIDALTVGIKTEADAFEDAAKTQ